MTGRRRHDGADEERRWLPWLFAGVALLIVGATERLRLSDQGDGFAAGMHPAVTIMPVVLAASFAFIGGLILRERPGHGLGRLLAWFGFSFALGVLIDHDTYHRSPLPAQEWVLLASGVGYVLFVVPLVTLTPLLFPTGRLPSPRWRLPLAVGGLGLAVTIGGNLIDPALSGDVPVDNHWRSPPWDRGSGSSRGSRSCRWERSRSRRWSTSSGR